jgi:hypothetical protein
LLLSKTWAARRWVCLKIGPQQGDLLNGWKLYRNEDRRGSPEVTMLRGVLLVVLATTLAQALPSCGGEVEKSEVVGWVEAKRIDSTSHDFLIVINSVEYLVPGYFWSQVEVGDLVKWDGMTWTIVKKRNASSRLPPVSFLPGRRA